MADKILAVDTSHLLYRTFYGVMGNKTRLSKRDQALATNSALQELKQYQRKFKSNVIITAFDDKESWRSDYARKNRMGEYRSRRNVFTTLKQRKQKAEFDRFRDDFEQLLRRTPGVNVVKGSKLESDDIIAGISELKNKGDKVNVVTLDKDLARLMTTSGVDVYDMRTQKKMSKRNLERNQLERVLRGRHSYGVRSVFRKLTQPIFNQIARGTMALEEAFASEPSNDASGMSARVRYRHNEVLLDVTKAPKKIKNEVKKALRLAFS